MTKDNLALLNFQDKWVKIVDKGLGDFDSLTSDERVWFNIETLIAQVDNGGLISFYYNSYAERVMETIDDLKKLGFADIADLLIQINKLFPGGQPSADIDERNDVISNWPDGKYDSLLDSLEKTFYSREKELEQKLIQHIQTCGLNR